MTTKYTLIGLLLFETGCGIGYKTQTIDIPRHKVKIYDSKIAVQNAYATYNINQVSATGRDRVTGFFSYRDNTIHCYTPFPEECLLHEYKHLLVKYGFKVPSDSHFKQ